MFKNYLRTAFRHVRNEKGFAAINVLGLAIGIACCLAITLFVRQEISYDRYHEHSDRIYRLTSRAGISGAGTHFAAASPVMAEVMRDEFSEVLETTRVLPSTEVVRAGDRSFREDRFYYADSTVFDVFSFPLIEGDARTALAAPHTVVLTRSVADKYFGSESPLGKDLQVGDMDYVVTGVMEDVPLASHFRFELLASLASLETPGEGSPEAWVSFINYYTYLLLSDEPSAAGAVRDRLPALVQRNVGSVLEKYGATFSLHLQPLTSIHLHSDLTAEIEPTSSIAYVYVFSSAALFILLIACINFVNLATARSLDRAREVGMRKVLGAPRSQLVGQFLLESVILVLVAVFTAVAGVWMGLPLIQSATGYELGWNPAADLPLLGGLTLFMMLVGLLAGCYPALFFSSYRPIDVLRGRVAGKRSGVTLRKGLVVAQFAISIILIVGTVVVARQIEFARGQKRGFDNEQVLVVPLPASQRSSLTALKNDLTDRPGITNVSATDHFPGGPINDAVHIPEGASDDGGIHFWRYNVDFGFLEVLRIPLAAGRSFSADRPSDSTAFIINETAARTLGWGNDALGRRIFEIQGDERVPRHVVGIVKDFHFESIRSEIKPLIIAIDPRPSYLLIRLQPGSAQETIAYLENRWTRTATAEPFEYSFLDQRFDALYRSEVQLSRVFRIFAVLALVIACLGLFALSTYTVRQRTKEIGIRKVLGATVVGLVVDLSKSFLALVIVGFAVAAPIAYAASRFWLEEFAYRIDPGIELFLVAGLIALLIAMATISVQAIRAALADPVETLRYE